MALREPQSNDDSVKVIVGQADTAAKAVENITALGKCLQIQVLVLSDHYTGSAATQR